jgi:STE24 endopeptidase
VVIACVVVATLWLVSLPFALAARLWAAHHDLAPQPSAAWLPAQLPSLAGEALVTVGAVVVILWLAGRLGERWWLVGAPLFALIAAAFLFLFGFAAQIGTNAPSSAALRAEVPLLELTESVKGTPVRVKDVRGVTREANAVTNGFGPSASVVLWSTLLDGRFTTGEVRFVLAHELGHVAHRHVLKAVGWAALVLVPLMWLLTVAARLRGGIADPGALPFVLVVLVVVGLLAMPLANLVSRRYEAEADWSALKATRDPVSGRLLFIDFAQTSLQQPNPPTWEYLWLEDHPTVAQRIAMVEAWARSRSRGGS